MFCLWYSVACTWTTPWVMKIMVSPAMARGGLADWADWFGWVRLTGISCLMKKSRLDMFRYVSRVAKSMSVEQFGLGYHFSSVSNYVCVFDLLSDEVR